MKHISARLCLLAVLVLVSSGVASAQTSAISGTVVDSAGGAIPGAPVVVKGEAGFTAEVVTNAGGVFSVPALNPGVYTVTVALGGFKTAVVSDLRLAPGTPLSVKVVLEVGQLEETITVQSSSELVNTQTATVAATLNVDQINKMPMPSRNALNAVTYLPGVNTTGINRDATVNGLPQSFINITLDGVTNNDNFNKTTDGFFAMVTPRQDAIEAVTVTSAAGGSDVGGHGAVSINFVTRSGTNRFTGSAYEYFRHPDLNSNTWFNNRNGLPKNDIRLNQYGARQGGPIVVPGLYDGRGKAFFFANYEELRLPNNFSRTRVVLHPRGQEGWFRYNVGSGATQQTREVNVLALAASRGFLATPDPTVMRVLGYINSAMTKSGVINATSDPLVNEYIFQSEGNQTEKQPVFRIDYNVSDRHRLSGTINQLWVVRDPDHLNSADVRFPGAPNYRKFVSSRPSRSITLRSNFGTNLVNELRGGVTRGGVSYFGHNQIDGQGARQYEDQGGFGLNIDGDAVLGAGLTNWWSQNTPSWRSAYAYTIDNSLSWQRSKHSLTFGGAAFLGRAWERAQTLVPTIALGFNTTQDTTNSMFVGGTAANATFPDASAGQLTDARALYALLTGRVLSIAGQAALDPATNKYVAFAPRIRAGKMDEYSLFVQDSWRMMPTLTVNAGLRWDLQLPFTPVNDVMSSVSLESVCGQSGVGDGSIYRACDFFNVGKNTGVVPQFDQFTTANRGYNTDWNNVAPNVGAAWRPNVQSGWLRSLLGDPEQATIRAGYSVAYERQGMAEFTTVFGPNQGSVISLTRSVTAGIIEPGETWPVLLRESNRLYNQPFNETPSFPIIARPNRADSLNAFHPDIRIASARTWTVSFQRSITRDMAAEIRYVGTKGVDQWSELNYNARDFINNGFIDEFRRAQANLQANNASGAANRSGSFAYFGPGTGTQPLPTIFGYLNGAGDPNNAALYTGGTNTWTNSTLAQRLALSNPAPQTLANDLDGTLARRQAALAAGIPANYFVVNPAVAANLVTDSGAFSDFHALQLELRRRLSRGVSANVNYQYALESGSAFQGFQFGRVSNPSATVRHAIKTQWDWELPVGRGKRFGSNMNGVLDGILGGWTFNGVGRIQARMVNFGNVRLVGMSKSELQKLYKFDLRVNPDTGLMTPYMLPDDIILNTRRAFSVSTTSPTGHSTTLGVPEGRYFAPANGPDCIQLKAGDCADRTLLIRAPWFSKIDIGVTKKFPLGGRRDFEIRADVLNVFNAVNFNPVANPGTGAGIFQATSAYSDISNTFDPGSRLGQLVFRFNW